MSLGIMSEAKRTLTGAALVCLSFVAVPNGWARDWDDAEPPKNGDDFTVLGQQMAQCAGFRRAIAESRSSRGATSAPEVWKEYENVVRHSELFIRHGVRTGLGADGEAKISSYKYATTVAGITRMQSEEWQYKKLRSANDDSRLAVVQESQAICKSVEGWLASPGAEKP